MLENFTKVIFLGSSDLMYNCARKVRAFYGTNLDIDVIETSYTMMKRKYIAEFGEVGAFHSKDLIFQFLRTIKERVFLFSINNPYIIPKDICAQQNFVMVNLHHALLPAHPGRNAEAWAIYEQDTWGGYTWHYISDKVDAGDIILQERIEITEETTAIMLLRQCEQMALKSFEKLLPFEKIEVYTKKQTLVNKRITKPKRSMEIPNNGILDLTWSISKQIAFLNAMNYGVACVLGKPKVIVKGELKTIIAYKFGEKIIDNSNSKIKQNVEDIILLEEIGKQLVIWLKK